jgi:peptide/nickel transport system substrate-binding protein
MFRRMLLTVMVVVIFGMLLFRPIGGVAAPPQGVMKQAIHAGQSADWLDPSISGFTLSALIPLYLFHDALVKPMPDGWYTPCLAESWTASPDHKVYEFKLRKGVKFHNGDEMTAEDVVFTFWRYKGAEAKFIHGKTEKVEAVNPYLVRFHFKAPFPEFIDYSAGLTPFFWIVPKKYVEKVGDAGFKKQPVGAGPYKFVEFVAGQRVVAEAFEGYWRRVPNIKRIELYIIPEDASRLARVKAGEADLATVITGMLYENAKKDPTLRVFHAPSPTRWYVDMTAQFDPRSPWSDLRVRKAASLAIDRKTLVEMHAPGSAPVGFLNLKGDSSAVDFPVDPYDPEQAKKLLAEAGYPKGFHGGKFYPYEGGLWPYGQTVAAYWKAVGIDVDIILLDKAANIAMREGGKMKGGSFISGAVEPTIGGVLSHLFGPTSYGVYPDFQSLWDQYQKEVTPNARKDLLVRLQKLIHERMRWIPLTSAGAPAVAGRRIKGNPYKIQPLIWFTAPFEDVELEK